MQTSVENATYGRQEFFAKAISTTGTALFLCRTPLQARICLKIIETEKIPDVDVFYYTQHDSESDRLYYARLQEVSKNTQYVYLSNKRYGIINYIIAYFLARRRFKHFTYKSVYLASIDALLFRAFLKCHDAALVYTFDDGTSNIVRHSSISFHAEDSGRTSLIRKLARLYSRAEIKNKSLRHYSIYRNFENICPPEKTVYLDIFPVASSPGALSAEMRFFIGQPFEEYLDAEQIARLQRFLADQKFDYYIRHPRENARVQAGIPFLEKKGELAETAIMAAAGGRVPSIYAGFSTVLFNIPSERARKYYLHFAGKDDAEATEMLDFARRAGCTIIEL